jgi:cysteine desulfurase/selenocysteine lyase
MQSDYETLQKQLNKDVAILAMAHVSNALGNIYPVEKICRIAIQQNILTVIDGTQAIAHMTVDVQKVNCDFYVFSGHKMYAPTGVGVLYGKIELLDALLPLRLGGEMITRVSFTDAEYQAPPLKFEGGTPNVAGVIGIGAAAKFLMANMDQIKRHEVALFESLRRGLDNRNDIRIYGNVGAKDICALEPEDASKTSTSFKQSFALYSFVFNNHHLNDVAALLYQANIAVRVGHHCAMPLMNLLNIGGTMRVSIACYTTEQDIQYFLETLNRVLDRLDNSELNFDNSAMLANKKLANKKLASTEIENSNLAISVSANSSVSSNSNGLVKNESHSLAIAQKLGQARGWDNQYRQLLLASKDLTILPIEMRTNENAVFGCESDLWIAFTNQKLCAYSQSKIIRGILAVLIEKAMQLNDSFLSGSNQQKSNAATTFDYFAYLTELNLTPFFSVGRRDGIQNAISAIKAKIENLY